MQTEAATDEQTSIFPKHEQINKLTAKMMYEKGEANERLKTAELYTEFLKDLSKQLQNLFLRCGETDAALEYISVVKSRVNELSTIIEETTAGIKRYSQYSDQLQNLKSM